MTMRQLDHGQVVLRVRPVRRPEVEQERSLVLVRGVERGELCRLRARVHHLEVQAEVFGDQLVERHEAGIAVQELTGVA
ncbi:MAG: hypothetical protein U0V56_03750 [Actinomycetota bacterium]